jgi:hypothetical protein
MPNSPEDLLAVASNVIVERMAVTSAPASISALSLALCALEESRRELNCFGNTGRSLLSESTLFAFS